MTRTKPATPLPWRIIKRATQVGLSSARIVNDKANLTFSPLNGMGLPSIVSPEQLAGTEYLVKAANAYPELVAIVQRLVHPATDDTDLDDARALLSKLGEGA